MSTLKRFLRRQQVEEITSLSTSVLYDRMAKGKFPKPIRLSAQRVVWLEDDVAAWQDEQLAQCDQPPARPRAKPTLEERRRQREESAARRAEAYETMKRELRDALLTLDAETLKRKRSDVLRADPEEKA